MPFDFRADIHSGDRTASLLQTLETDTTLLTECGYGEGEGRKDKLRNELEDDS